MKMMFIIHALNKMGGAEKMLTIYANHFASQGDEVSITLLSKDTINFELHESIKIYNYENSQYYRYLPQKIRFIMQQVSYISDSIKDANPDIVVSFIAAINILSVLASRRAKKPVILSERNSYHEAFVGATRKKFDIKIWKALRRMVYPYADTVIALTQEDKPKYHYVKVVSVIPNPLVLKNKHQNIQRENIILSVGRLHEVKGFDMLIEAFSKVNTQGWKLIIAGEGDERSNLEKLIEELNLSDKVELVGLIKDVELYYKRASIYVLSSKSEGYPGALCEAMGYGCASIAFDCPTGPKEIITDNKDALLIEPNSITELSKAIEDLIDNKEKREKLALNAMKIKERLDIDAISKQWKEIMTTTIDRYNKK